MHDLFDEFDAFAGLPLSLIEQIEPGEIPQPYQDLLVHRSDMTPRLESFHRQRIHLSVLRSCETGDRLYRQVTLVLVPSGTAVEFGVIRIELALFNPDSQRLIREGRQPLGSILNEQRIEHASDPRAFLRVTSNGVINSGLSLTGSQLLYGRQNRIRDSRQRALAEMVEILPPIPS